jgi:hypothetical protein
LEFPRAPTGPAAAIPTGGDLVGVPSMVGKSIIADRASMVHNHGSMGQHGAQPWIPGPAWCTTMDPRASMVHKHGSQGTWLEFDRVISADRASSSSPHGRGPGWSSLDGSQGTWLEFDRVIIADRASDVHTPSFSCQRCAHTKLFLPAMCTHQAFLAIDVHITGPAAAVPKGGTRLDVPSRVGKSIIAGLCLHTLGERLTTSPHIG